MLQAQVVSTQSEEVVAPVITKKGKHRGEVVLTLKYKPGKTVISSSTSKVCSVRTARPACRQNAFNLGGLQLEVTHVHILQTEKALLRLTVMVHIDRQHISQLQLCTRLLL